MLQDRSIGAQTQDNTNERQALLPSRRLFGTCGEPCPRLTNPYRASAPTKVEKKQDKNYRHRRNQRLKDKSAKEAKRVGGRFFWRSPTRVKFRKSEGRRQWRAWRAQALGKIADKTFKKLLRTNPNLPKQVVRKKLKNNIV